eukprot:gene2768-biopygen2991
MGLSYLSLYGNSLTGSIPASFAFLMSLVYLNVAGLSRTSPGNLGGSIPFFIGLYSALTTVDLRFNSFTGTLPSTIGYLTNLVSLYIEGTSLGGSIPTAIGQLVSLSTLWLDTNSFVGPIPSSVQSLSVLKNLRLGFNSLSQAIPSALCRTYSYSLNLAGGGNLFSCYPACFGSISTANFGTAVVCTASPTSSPANTPTSPPTRSPTSPTFRPTPALSNTPPVQSSILCDLRNAFNGGPDSSWNCVNAVCGASPWTGVGCSASSAVTSISLVSKSITGTLPFSLGLLTSLAYINLGANSIRGSIPFSLGGLTSLSYLSLYGNSLTGSIPASFAFLMSLVYLNVAGLSRTSPGNLGGSVPSFIGLYSALTTVDLRFNSFTGTLPSTIGYLSNLVSLYIEGTSLGGSIPTAIGQLVSLSTLWLDTNSFFGSIPSTLQSLSALKNLRLGFNSLSQAIPSALCRSYSYTLNLAGGGNSFSCYASCLSSVSTANLGASVICRLPSVTSSSANLRNGQNEMDVQ